MLTPVLLAAGIIALLAIVLIVRAVKIVPQAHVGIVERFGRFQRQLQPGLHLLVPFLDRLAYTRDMREQVVVFQKQPMITAENVTVEIDIVFYFRITDPFSATYEVENLLMAVEQLTMTTLRNKVGEMDLEETLTSREQINASLRGVLDTATQRWGIRVERVEIKAIDPPPTVTESMEKQLKADREKRATILAAQGDKEAQILRAEGSARSAVLSAEGAKDAAVLQAQGEAQAITLRAEAERSAAVLAGQGEAEAIASVFAAIHAGTPTEELLTYEYLRQLPALADGQATKLVFLPSGALETLGAVGAIGEMLSGANEATPPGSTARTTRPTPAGAPRPPRAPQLPPAPRPGAPPRTTPAERPPIPPPSLSDPPRPDGPNPFDLPLPTRPSQGG